MLPFATYRAQSNMKIKSNQIIYYTSYSYANDKKFNLVLIVPVHVWMIVCMVCAYISSSSSSATVTARPSILLSLLVSIIWTYKSKQAVERASKTSIASKEMEMTERSLTTLTEANSNSSGVAKKKFHIRNSCGFESKYTVCIILLSILIHLFANTIQNIVIHVIHLSTQTFRFARSFLFSFSHSIVRVTMDASLNLTSSFFRITFASYFLIRHFDAHCQ